MPKQIDEKLQEIKADDEEDYGVHELDKLIVQNLESNKIRGRFEISDLKNLSGRRRRSSKIRITYQDQDLYFLTKNLRWLGKGNPENVKRIQIKLTEEEKQLIYHKRLFLIGIYHFRKSFVACYLEVTKEEKKERKWNNSSVMQVRTEELKDTLADKGGHHEKEHKLGAIYLFRKLTDLFLHLFPRVKKETFKHLQVEANRKFTFQSWLFKSLTQKEKSEIKAIETSPKLKETTKEQLINSRIGQGDFRKEVIKELGMCLITGVSNKKLLIASHIKPWRESNNEERLDVNNGLLFTPTYDRLFDLGFISFGNKGDILLSKRISGIIRNQLGLKKRLVTIAFGEKRKKYLEFHRKKIFKK